MKTKFKTVCCCLILSMFAQAVGDPNSPWPYCSFRSMGYYPDYNVDELPVSQIRYDQLTDIIYFSLKPNSDGSLNFQYTNPDTLQELVATAHQNNVEVSIAVGGADNRSEYFSDLVSSQSTRSVFIANLVQYCLTYNLDGINLDWEPVTDPIDQQNYTLLIQEIKAAMLPHSLTLSVDVLVSGEEFGPEAYDSIDWLHIMAYDLYKSKPHSLYEDAIKGLTNWECRGFPRPKIIFGLPFFGRNTIAGDWTFYSYRDIVQDHLSSPIDPNIDEIDGINFNGIDTIQEKTQYVIENGYGGVMYWELTNDTNDVTSLLTATMKTIQTLRPPDLNCDDVINLGDQYHLIENWLNTDCDVTNAWCQRCDLDASSNVDMEDMEILCKFWKRVLQGDINNDTHVNIHDLAMCVDKWLWEGPCGSIPEDIYIDGLVNYKDLNIISKNWLIQ